MLLIQAKISFFLLIIVRRYFNYIFIKFWYFSLKLPSFFQKSKCSTFQYLAEQSNSMEKL